MWHGGQFEYDTGELQHAMNWPIVLRSQEVKIEFTDVSSGASRVGRILGMVSECEYLGWPEQTTQHNQHGQAAWAKSTSDQNSETAEACTF